jgi:hypothetical protein
MPSAVSLAFAVLAAAAVFVLVSSAVVGGDARPV